MKKGTRLHHFKTQYSVEGQFKLDLNKVHLKTRHVRPKYTASSAIPERPNIEDEIDGVNQIPHPEVEPVSGEISIKICSSYHKYRLAIVERSAFLILKADMTAFAILDFDEEKSILKNDIKFVYRNGTEFVCPCDTERFQFLDNVGANSLTDFDTLYQPCIHAKLLKDIYNSSLVSKVTDAETEASGLDHIYSNRRVLKSVTTDTPMFKYTDCDIVEVPFLQNHFIVCINNSYGSVHVTFGMMKCSCLCFTSTTKCDHIQYIDKQLSVYEESGETSEILDKIYQRIVLFSEKEQYELKCLSSTPIPFDLNETMSANIKQNSSFPINSVGVLQFCPPDKCSCGHDLNEPVRESYDALVINRYNLIKVHCFSRYCPGCQTTVYYDGCSDCLLNMGKFLVHYEVLRDYMFQFLLSRTTMYSFYNVWKQHQKDGGNHEFSKLFPYRYFRWSWYNFLSLLDIDYPKFFICDQADCGISPKLLVFDGTSLGFQKAYLTSSFSKDIRSCKAFKGSRHADRVFIDSKPLRQKMEDFCRRNSVFTDEEFREMKTLVNKHQPSLSPFMSYLENIGCTSACPEEYKMFILMLATNSPVCGTFSYTDIHLVKQIISSDCFIQDSVLMKSIQDEIPILFNLLVDLKEVPAFLKTLLLKVVEVCEKTFINYDVNQTQASLSENELAFYPHFPKIVERGVYEMDKKKPETVCTKKGGRHPTLIPGIFTVFCPHGICYGFEVMDSVESPDRPFTFLKTRFKDPPPVIIYDNACNLHSFCLNRDPALFKKTKFRVDGLHWDGHSACSIGYKGQDYPAIKRINTQVVEQSNAKLKKLKSSLSYMKPKNFMKSLKFFFWYGNKKIKEV